MLRTLTVLLNGLILLFVFYQFTFGDGIPRTEEIPLVLLFLASPITTLLYVYKRRSQGEHGLNSWLSSWIQRKSVEEQIKLQAARDKLAKRDEK